MEYQLSQNEIDFIRSIRSQLGEDYNLYYLVLFDYFTRKNLSITTTELKTGVNSIIEQWFVNGNSMDIVYFGADG